MLSLRFKSGHRSTKGSHTSTVRPKNPTLERLAPVSATRRAENASGTAIATNSNPGVASDEASPPFKKKKRQSNSSGQVTQNTTDATLKAPQSDHVNTREARSRACLQEKEDKPKRILSANEGDSQQPHRKKKRPSDRHAPSKLCKAKLETHEAEGDQTTSYECVAKQPNGVCKDKCNKPGSRSAADSGHSDRGDQTGSRQDLLQTFAARGMLANGSTDLLERLHGGQFRSLNEFLYTTEGRQAWERYQNDPRLFDIVGYALSCFSRSTTLRCVRTVFEGALFHGTQAGLLLLRY